ncbi:MAG: sulfatase family protein [Planctomycetota bacterium]|jgi:arylsulfatase A-like enzyme
MNKLNRRRFLYLGAAPSVAMVWGLAKSLFGVQQSSRISTKSERPNILWICTDQQRWDTIGALGNNHVHTPNIDRLVNEGVAFDHAFCTSPICTPSRAGFLTGMYPCAVKACKNGAESWAEQAPLVTKLIRDMGYICGLSGKLHLASAMKNDRETRPEDDGYSVFHYSHSPHQGGRKNDYLVWLQKHGYSYKGLQKLDGQAHARLHQTTWCTDRAIDFIRVHKAQPWLFSLNIYDPHPPFNPPRSYVSRYDTSSLPGPALTESDIVEKSRLNGIVTQKKPSHYSESDAKQHQTDYWAQIDLIDENVGRLLSTLEETGQDKSTVIIFTSDHGDMCGDHGMRAKGCRFYEGLIRVPLIFWFPQRFRKDLVSKALVELTDIAPTLLDIVGEQIPSHMQGRSLLPILEGRTNPNIHREFVRSEFYDTLDPGGLPPALATMIRTRDFKLVVYHGHAIGELFNLSKDPNEFDNLWNQQDYGDKRFELLKRCFDATILACSSQMPLLESQSDAYPTAGLQEGETVRSVGHISTERSRWKTVFESDRYNMVVDHTAENSALFDLSKDSGKKLNIWNDARYRKISFDLLKKCFDATVLAIDTGPQRVGRY